MPQHRLFRAAALVAALFISVGFVQPVNVEARGASIRAANKVLELSLPWGKGDTWRLTGGPHSNVGRGRPWSSLDFNGPISGRSYAVRAAAGGIVTRPCRNLVQIRHADGWTTSYYHLARIKVRAGQRVATGQLLGYTSTKAGCGGSASGPHLHFALKYGSKFVNLDGLVIGGWTVREGNSQYVGCMVRGGQSRCTPNARLYNFGPS